MNSFKLTRGTCFMFLFFAFLLTFPALFATTLLGRVFFGFIAVVIFFLVCGRWYGHTLYEWARRGLVFRSSPIKYAQVASVEGRGRVWDGDKLTAYISLSSPSFTPSRITPSGDVLSLQIPLERLRDVLVQYDILVDSIAIYNYGHKFTTYDRIASAVNVGIGPTPHDFWGDTYVSVSVSPQKSLDSISLRAIGGDRVLGLHKTLYLATERVRRELEAVGFIASIVSEQELMGLLSKIHGIIREPLTQRRWGVLGGGSGLKIAAYTPKNTVLSIKDSKGIKDGPHLYEWRKTVIERKDAAVNTTEGVDTITQYLAYISPKESDLELVSTYGLNREYGIQDKLIRHFVPHYVHPDVDIPGKTLYRKEQYSLPLYPSHLGVFLGFAEGKDKLFLALTPSTSDVLYITDTRIGQLIALRTLLSGENVDIEIDTKEWIDFVKRLNHPKLTYRAGRAKGIVFTTHEKKNASLKYPGTCVIVVDTEDGYKDAGDFTLVAVEGAKRASLQTIYGDFKVDIAPSSMEANLLNVQPQRQVTEAAPVRKREFIPIPIAPRPTGAARENTSPAPQAPIRPVVAPTSSTPRPTGGLRQQTPTPPPAVPVPVSPPPVASPVITSPVVPEQRSGGKIENGNQKVELVNVDPTELFTPKKRFGRRGN